MPGIFEGRAVVVTGASSGIGRVIAMDLARAGAQTWLVGRSQKDLDATAAMIAEAGGAAAHAEAIDLRQRGPLGALIERVAATHPYLFAVINNAGIMHPEPILSGAIDRWQAMLDVNVMAVLEGCKSGVEAMRRHGKPGHIINIGSVQARFEAPGVYGLTKQAVETIGTSLREELEEDNIRVATVIPGGFVTKLARGFAPEQLAKIAENFRLRGLDRGAPGTDRLVGDPQHVANAVHYILEQPIDLNIQEIIVRPPVSTKAA
jgi:NADP-dependent 3-hydroxy acid dehydrogenase YdfG